MIYLGIGACLLIWVVYKNNARFKLNCWLFNDSVDETLDLLIRQGLEAGIRSVEHDSALYYELQIEFNNGVKMEAWDRNKYYGWLCEGRIKGYKWSSKRPTAETMVSLREAIKRYYLG